MRSNEQRVNIIIGQLGAIKKMLADKNNNCAELIIQLKAIKAATSSLLEKIVSEEMERCLTDQGKGQQDKVLKILKELASK